MNAALNLHHVIERLGLSVFDHAFFAPGVIFIVGGLLTIRAGRKPVSASQRN